MIDSSFKPLIPYLTHIDTPTLWLADENSLSLLNNLPASNNLPIQEKEALHLVTNRYDVFQAAKEKNISATFNDFDLHDLPFIPQRIIYRISKEKALTHHLLNQAADILGDQGQLVISGKKQEGTKGYADKLKKVMGCDGQLKKSGLDYYGCFSQFSDNNRLDDQDYQQYQELTIDSPHIQSIYSKPGVFGWNKIDEGTELLLNTLPSILKTQAQTIGSILDLGCGYGWIFLNLPFYLPQYSFDAVKLTATDNNAAAILCAKKNAEKYNIQASIIADDCAAHIDEQFSKKLGLLFL